MISIDALSVKFGGVTALDNLCVEFADDVIGLIGPNGAGKTTLINALSGFVTPASGTVKVGEQDILKLKPHQRARWGLARSFQKVQTVPELTVDDHIRVVLDARPMREQAKRKTIDEVLEFTGLTHSRWRKGHELDPYAQRMTEIARCLAGSPKIVMLDEPGGGLSETEVQTLREAISNIKPVFNAVVILIDHDVELIKSLCSHTAVLDFGKLIAYGPTATVFNNDKVKTAYLGR